LKNLKRELLEQQEKTSKVNSINNHAFRGISSPGSTKDFKVSEEIADQVKEENMRSQHMSNDQSNFRFGFPDIMVSRNSRQKNAFDKSGSN